MTPSVLQTCPSCQGARHVQNDDGSFRRCPVCFLQSNLERHLVARGYPKAWANLSLDKLAAVLGEADPFIQHLRGLFDGQYQALHLYGPPSEARQIAFAAVLRSFLERGDNLNILDTGELANRHFEIERRGLRLKYGPTVITVGREIEPKLGLFYFRSSLEFAVPREQPIVVFSDQTPAQLRIKYPDLDHLVGYAGLIPLPIPK